jgi:hypothetical protein
MARYRITAESSGGFTAEVIQPDGSVAAGHNLPTRTAALDWVAERLIVERERPLNQQDD